MGKKLRNTGRLFLVLGLTASFLVGCGSREAQLLDPKNPVALTLWHYYNGAQKTAMDEMVAQFNETVGREKGIMVSALSQGGVNQLIDNVRGAAMEKVGAEPLPDIFAAYAETAYEIDQLGKVASVNQNFSKEELDAFVTSYLDEGRFGGSDEIKIIPTAKSTELLYLNLTDWQKFLDGIEGHGKYASVSEEDLATWEGLNKVAQVYYQWTDDQTPKIEADGKAFFGLDSLANFMIISSKQLGWDIVDNTGEKPVFRPNLEILQKLWDNYYVPHMKGYFGEMGRFRSDDTKIGYVIASIGSTSSSKYFPDKVTLGDGSQYPIQAKTLPVPVFEGGQPYCAQQGAGMTITKSTEQKELAAAIFLKWFTQPERNLSFALDSGYLPVNKIAYEPEQLEAGLKAMGAKEGTDSILSSMVETVGKQYRGYRMYTAKPFAGGVAVRRILETSLKDLIAQDQEKAQRLQAQGASPHEAIKEFLEPEHFQQWSHRLTVAINEALE